MRRSLQQVDGPRWQFRPETVPHGIAMLVWSVTHSYHPERSANAVFGHRAREYIATELRVRAYLQTRHGAVGGSATTGSLRSAPAWRRVPIPNNDHDGEPVPGGDARVVVSAHIAC